MASINAWDATSLPIVRAPGSTVVRKRIFTRSPGNQRAVFGRVVLCHTARGKILLDAITSRVSKAVPKIRFVGEGAQSGRNLLGFAGRYKQARAHVLNQLPSARDIGSNDRNARRKGLHHD